MNTPLNITATRSAPLGRQSVEFVERKGIGHPDTICDSVMESISAALSHAYIERTGHVQHYNVDKGLLVAGQTHPRLGGGEVLSPMRLVIGDRATSIVAGRPLPLNDIVATAARGWFRNHLQHVDPDRHLVLQNELRPGSAELAGIFSGGQATANDTSVGVGFAPLSETEHLVLAAERFLNSGDFKANFPETGEDVKVMGVRTERTLHLTIAIAFIDHFVWEAASYFHRKAEAAEELKKYLQTKMQQLDAVELDVNSLDDPDRGTAGMYLTVLGTSAESADSGQVGRGNRVNGLISFFRPMTLEAAAGKNPISHVGKIYNLQAHEIADRVWQASDAIEEAYVWLCSRIGSPISQPWFASVQLSLASGASLGDVRQRVAEVVEHELAGADVFARQLACRELAVS